MKRQRYLVKRDELYFAVVPVPARLQGILQRKQIWRSLKTKSYVEAIVSLNIEVNIIMSFFEMWTDHEGKEVLAERHFEEISMKCMTQLLREDQEKRIEFSDADNTSALLDFKQQQDIIQMQMYKKALCFGNYSAASAIVGKHLANSGMVWDESSFVYKNLCMEVLKKLATGYDKILKRYNGIWEEDYITQYQQQDFFNTQLNRAIKEYRSGLTSFTECKKVDVESSHIPNDTDKIIEYMPANIGNRKTTTLGRLIEKFNNSVEIKQRSSSVRTKYSSYQYLLLLCLGENTNISKIGRKDFKNLLEILKQTPTNIRKFKEFRGLGIQDIIKMVEESGTYSLLSASSINDYLEHLQALLKWAKREDYTVTDDFSDIRAKKETKAKFDRMPFSEEMIKKIMLSDDMQLSKADKDKTLYWVTVLAFTTGMRIGEICQLKLQDIRQQDGIDYISVNTEGNKSVKTEQSIRDIPINDVLKNAGFMDYINSLRGNYSGTSSIFPNYVTGANRTGDPISKRFARLLIREGIKTNKLTFHSTRHNYRDFIRDSELSHDETIIALELCGWATGSSSVHNNYGAGVSIKKKLAVVNKIKFGALAGLLV